MADYGSGQGQRDVETAGVVFLRLSFKNCENTRLGRKMPFRDGLQARRKHANR
jgi:hypothetical protein